MRAIEKKILKKIELNTKLGPMMAIGDERALYLLEFIESQGLEYELEKLKADTNAVIELGFTAPLRSIKAELKAYFQGALTEFSTPLHLVGSPFQQEVWQALIRIPYGFTGSYLQQAQQIGKPTACRAVANANAANQIAIVIPCHRVIKHNGDLGGYNSGIERKKWLIEHEQKIVAGKK